MEAVIITVHTVVNVNARKVHVARLNDADRMIGALKQCYVAYRDVPALVKQKVIRTAVASAARWWRYSASGTVKLETLAIDHSRTFDGEGVRFHREDESDIAILQRGIAAERNRGGCAILFAIGAAETFALRGEMQRRLPRHRDCAA